MLDIGWSELVVIGIVALIVIGPKELPGVLRAIGHWAGKIRRMASDFQGQFQEAMREAEVADLKRQFDEAAGSATNFTSGFDDPLAKANREIESALSAPTTPVPDAPAPQADTPTPPVPAADAPAADEAADAGKRGGSA